MLNGLRQKPDEMVNSTKAPPWSLAECSNDRPSSITTTRAPAPQSDAHSSWSVTDLPDPNGRASCRERACQYVSISVVAGSLKKQRHANRSNDAALLPLIHHTLSIRLINGAIVRHQSSTVL